MAFQFRLNLRSSFNSSQMRMFCQTHYINEYELKEQERNSQATYIHLCDECEKTIA